MQDWPLLKFTSLLLLLLLLLTALSCVCRSPYNRKAALDAGDYGLGFAANSLELGCDCLGDVTYFDAVVNNAAGENILRRIVPSHQSQLSWAATAWTI
jgi:hypothetical protein